MIELSQGQELELADGNGDPLTRLQVGLGWDKVPTAGAMGTGAPDVDLDASAVAFANRELGDLAFYNNLQFRDGSVVHLGDNLTGKGSGDDEVLSVDLTKIHPRIDTVFFLISSYHGHTFEWINNAYVRLVDDNDVELARYTLTGGLDQTGLVLAKIFRDGERWKLRAIGEGIPVKLPTESVRALTPYL